MDSTGEALNTKPGFFRKPTSFKSELSFASRKEIRLRTEGSTHDEVEFLEWGSIRLRD